MPREDDVQLSDGSTMNRKQFLALQALASDHSSEGAAEVLEGGDVSGDDDFKLSKDDAPAMDRKMKRGSDDSEGEVDEQRGERK